MTPSQRQLAHTNPRHHLDLLQGTDPDEIIAAVHARRAPMMAASVEPRI